MIDRDEIDLVILAVRVARDWFRRCPDNPFMREEKARLITSIFSTANMLGATVKLRRPYGTGPKRVGKGYGPLPWMRRKK